jgi:S-adenosylmethionine:tRNA ribosyltransferase-isomerase
VSLLVSDFDFELPAERIAQQPPAVRGESRMLRLERGTGRWQDLSFGDLPGLLRPGDVLVVNDTRVIPARLYGERLGPEGTGPPARAEILLAGANEDGSWQALVRPGRRIGVGDRLRFASAACALEAEVTARGEHGERTLRFAPAADFFARLEALGHVPLPPYIRRAEGDGDRDRYQTVYSRQRGSAAAPTAGLHFTPGLLERVRARGVEVCSLTLHVGLGTFAPLRVERLADIRLHREHYTLPAATASAVEAARREGRRVIAVGTTTVRALEHCARLGDRLEPHSGSTDIFLSPGSRFLVTSALLTNFHLPRSSLLMLVSAFSTRERVLAAYRHAVEAGYRFFSYGDCMFLC